MSKDKPLILAFVSNLYFTTRIESTAEKLGYQLRFIEDADEIAPPGLPSPEGQLGEQLVGPGAELLIKLTRWQPVLIIFDLDNKNVPWKGWITLIKSVSSTRRMPVLCFGPHVRVEVMQTARDAGADVVVSRSRFTSALPNLLGKYAQIPDWEAIETSCRQPLHPQAIKGLEAFNRGEFFDAHEYLEEAWMDDDSVGRDLYRGVLQIAVAYYHIKNNNFRGAAKMLLRVRQWIDPLPDYCRGINVAKLRQEAYTVHNMLLELGPERLDEFDQSLMKSVQFQSS